jgi:hypothetical protein
MGIFDRSMTGRRRSRYFQIAFLVAAISIAAWTLYLFSQTMDADFKPIQVVTPFPPITEFPVKRVQEASTALNPSELVLGVTVGKESRAYPLNALTGPAREILNDSLGGEPIAATW